MFSGKELEQLSRSTQYRIQKILFGTDDEINDYSTDESIVSSSKTGIKLMLYE